MLLVVRTCEGGRTGLFHLKVVRLRARCRIDLLERSDCVARCWIGLLQKAGTQTFASCFLKLDKRTSFSLGLRVSIENFVLPFGTETY